MGTNLSDPKTIEDIFNDFISRRDANIFALTRDADELYLLCDPAKENLCLYGHPDGNWEVTRPIEYVPVDIPEPTLGINFGKIGLSRKQWISKVAMHSDSWLLRVAFFFGGKLNKNERMNLFDLINNLPSVTEVVEATKHGNLVREKGTTSRGDTKKRKTNPKGEGSNNMDDASNLCGQCAGRYAVGEFWIACDACFKWYHGNCVKISPEEAESIKQYECPLCKAK